MDRRKLITAKELELLWDRSSSTVDRILKKNKIDRIIQSCRKNEPIFYDRAECERARPFINQPEQKEVEKVENVNSLETELDSEELASENGSALNDAELAAIITACKDPVDKIMILSALCFGVKSGELSYLDLRDISGADICLQSPSGVVKMRIPKQYEDARTELLTYYVDNGNNLSGDMPVFLNRSGIRMTRQGLNNRMKSVSESANIGRDVKLADLRATFAQNIYKKTEKNIASVHKYLRLSENTNIMGYLLETRSKEQKTMPVDLMNSLTASYQAKESPTIAEPTEQTPDIIPADTIDLFTMSELESELKNRGVELTAEVRAKINASDMPEMQHIATMLRGNAKSIAIRLSVLNEIAGQLAGEIKNISEEKTGLFIGALFKNCTDSSFYLDKELKPCPFCGMNSIVIDCEEISTGYWVARLQCSNCEVKLELDDSTKEIAADLLINQWNERPRDEDFAKTKAGAKSKYKPEFDEIAFNMASANKTDEEIAQNLKISMDTFYRYKREIPSFADALNSGRAANPFIITDSQCREKADRYFELKDFMEMQKQLNDMQKMIEMLSKKLDGVGVVEKKIYMKNNKVDKVIVTETKLEDKK